MAIVLSQRSISINRNTLIFVLAAVCGFAWGHNNYQAVVIISTAVPLLWSIANNRWLAGATVFVYYLAASHALPHGVGIFFKESAPVWLGWVLWISSGLINSTVWFFTWHFNLKRKAIGAIVSLILTAIPPIGIIGWVSPLNAAGWLFPHLGFIGLLLTLTLAAAFAAKSWILISIIFCIAMLANFTSTSPKLQHASNWFGQDTHFHHLQSNHLGQLNSRLKLILDHSKKLPPGHVLVLPETILPANHPNLFFIEPLLADAHEQLKAKGSIILVGAEFVSNGQSIENGLIALGDDRVKPLIQRVPVPIGMWRPWSRQTFRAHLFNKGTAQIQDQVVAYAICYEQLLVFPILISMTNSPTILIGAANDWWARNTNIPVIQKQTLNSWGRLFNIPVIHATNL